MAEGNIWEALEDLQKVVYRQGKRIDELERRNAQLEIYVSELRHEAGITDVDELIERMASDQPSPFVGSLKG